MTPFCGEHNKCEQTEALRGSTAIAQAGGQAERRMQEQHAEMMEQYFWRLEQLFKCFDACHQDYGNRFNDHKRIFKTNRRASSSSTIRSSRFRPVDRRGEPDEDNWCFGEWAGEGAEWPGLEYCMMDPNDH